MIGEGKETRLLYLGGGATGSGNQLPESHSAPGHSGCHRCPHHRSV